MENELPSSEQRPVYKDTPPFIVLTPDEGARWHADDALRAEVFSQVQSLGGTAQVGYGGGLVIDVLDCPACRAKIQKTRDGKHHPGFNGKRFYRCRITT